MANSVISININQIVNGSTQVQAATVNLQSMANAIKKVQDSAKTSPFKEWVINAGAMGSALMGLNSSLNELSEGYLSFDKSMRAVNTMAGKDAEGFSQMTSQVNSLAKTIPLAREELANGLYQVISNGVPEDNWLSFLEASAKSAVGGMADLGGVVTVTSTLIKNYGLSWEDAISIQDKIQTTAKNGVTSFEQLQQALPKVAANASTLGVSIDELMGSFATLTGVSGNTAEVSTQLAAIFTALIKPSSQAAKMAQEMGIQFDAAIQAKGGFQNFIQDLDASVKAYAQQSGMLSQEIYSKLFGSAESLRALIPLTGELADKYVENVSAMSNASGSIEDAFKDMSSTGEASAQLLKNRFGTLSDWIGKGASQIKKYVAPLAQMGQASAGLAALGSAFRLVAENASKLKVITPALDKLGISAQGATHQARALATQLGITAKKAHLLLSSLKLTGVGLTIWGVGQLPRHYQRQVPRARIRRRSFVIIWQK